MVLISRALHAISKGPDLFLLFGNYFIILSKFNSWLLLALVSIMVQLIHATSKVVSIAIKLTIDVIDLLSNSEQMVLTELFSSVFAFRMEGQGVLRFLLLLLLLGTFYFFGFQNL